jgi:hypothetical protein
MPMAVDPQDQVGIGAEAGQQRGAGDRIGPGRDPSTVARVGRQTESAAKHGIRPGSYSSIGIHEIVHDKVFPRSRTIRGNLGETIYA